VSVSEVVEEWLNETNFSAAYLFGSLLHHDGVQFDPSKSDIDIVCLFSERGYFNRWRTINDAREKVQSLNTDLLTLLSRDVASEPIASVLPVSQLELRHGIHKSGAVDFFSSNPFHCVGTGTHDHIGSSYESGLDGTLHGALDAVREAQVFRNKVLAVSPTGQCKVGQFESADTLPKKLTRSAAQVRFAHDKAQTTEERLDVNEGFVYMLQLLTARRSEHPEVEDLLRRVLVRSNRGRAKPLSVADQLLLWEILFDDVTPLLDEKESVTRESKLSSQSTTTRQPSRAVREVVAERAAYSCQFPGCQVPLGEMGIGEIAFIASSTEGGPRYSENVEVNDPDNMLFLCPTHHRMIDSKPDQFPPDKLKTWTRNRRDTDDDLFSADNLFTLIRLISSIV
jgi:predicted nucleotidyltransferase